MGGSRRKPGHWMQLPIDERILEVLDSDLLLSPTIIADNIEKTREEVNRRLSVLVDYGVVTRVRRGRYRITSDGERYLAGDLDGAELGEESTDSGTDLS